MVGPDEPLNIERRGADAGLNPIFGDWHQTFEIQPVPYRDGGARLRTFREAMQANMKNQFFFSGEVRLEIELHLDVQTVLETSETADVDNFAKAILDGLKGPNGILFDDTQVQCLTVYWLDTHASPSFRVSIQGSPDDFVLKPQSFYELANGLWYPHGRRTWTVDGPEEQPEIHHWVALLLQDAIAGAEKRSRHALRQAGFDRLSAYRRSRYLASSAQGFHKSRLDAAFECHSRRAWLAQHEQWKAAHPGEIDEFMEIVDSVRETRETMAALLRGELPSAAGTKPDGDRRSD